MKDLLIYNPKKIFLPCRYEDIPSYGQNTVHCLQDQSIVISRGKVREFRKTSSLQGHLQDFKVLDSSRKSITPGFVDTHTHMVYGGNRSEEFELRARGTTYLQLLESGNGINRTVRDTRSSSLNELLQSSMQRLATHISNGVTTVEIKTGYGLRLDAEERMLRVMEIMEKFSGIKIMKTLLSLHAIPTDRERKEYLQEAEKDILFKLGKRVDFVDSFCDQGAFSPEETEHFFQAASKLRIPARLHADEIRNIGALRLTEKFKIRSVDHLLHSSAEEIKLANGHGAIPTILPGTAFSLGEKYADAGSWIKEGIPVGVASDVSPLSPVTDMKFHGNLAVRFCGMSPNEVFNGMTTVGSSSLGLDGRKGSLEVGMDADMLISDVDDVRDLYYNWSNVKFTVLSKGRIINMKKIMTKSITS